jgi:hypothetical protein
MEKIINKLIDYHIKDVDIYTHGGSTWLIFTKTKQWVIELTDNKTLWYNYNFFNTIFSYASLEVVQNQHLITKWVEDNIINGVKETSHNATMFQSMKVEDTIDNGVKQTIANNRIIERVEDAIDNGVKETKNAKGNYNDEVEDTIQNGVKTTYAYPDTSKVGVNDTIQNGVKETKMSPTYTEYGDWLDGDERLDNIIQNGIKETQFNTYENKSWIEGVIKKGVKETRGCVSKGVMGKVDIVIKKGVKETLNTEYMPQVMVEDTIENGVKQTLPEVGKYINDVEEVIKDGVKAVNSYDEYKRGPVNAFGYIDDIIETGIKETKKLNESVVDWVSDIIDNGVKETYDDTYHHKGRIDGVIKNGVKEIKKPTG